MLEKARALGGDLPYTLSGLGQVFALAGDHASSRSILAKLHACAREGYIPTTCFAIVHLGLGERDQTLDWLEKGCEEQEMRLAILKVHPVYDELRGHPRFQAILKRLGLE
jgi:hypothetical protein